jgi:hypothetical protein
MTQEEAKKILKQTHDNGFFSLRTALEVFFPEFKESEDEQMRKQIIAFLRSQFVNDNIADWKVAPWIAWLEKQQGIHTQIDVDKMVSKYASTKETDSNSMPLNCQIRAYRQGINDVLSLIGNKADIWFNNYFMVHDEYGIMTNQFDTKEEMIEDFKNYIKE